MTRYEVTHKTEYRYDAPVSVSYGQMHLLPRDLPGQRVDSTSVVVVPHPIDYRPRRDFFGNWTAYFAITEPHESLLVTTSSVVEVAGRRASDNLFASGSWEDAAARVAGRLDPDSLDARQFLLESPHVELSDDLAAYARVSFTPGRPITEAVADLVHRIHAEFQYAPGHTSVSTPLETVMAERKGVCQDFAHLGTGCLRSIGLPARYVSGYLETVPPPGKARLTGADVSHAWLSVFVPDAGWLDVDPTNDQFVDDRYVITGWGRDYSDVPPLKGVIFTDGSQSKLRVTVDVVPLDQ